MALHQTRMVANFSEEKLSLLEKFLQQPQTALLNQKKCSEQLNVLVYAFEKVVH
jgi:hypothetical protein